MFYIIARISKHSTINRIICWYTLCSAKNSSFPYHNSTHPILTFLTSMNEFMTKSFFLSFIAFFVIPSKQSNILSQIFSSNCTQIIRFLPPYNVPVSTRACIRSLVGILLRTKTFVRAVLERIVIRCEPVCPAGGQVGENFPNITSVRSHNGVATGVDIAHKRRCSRYQERLHDIVPFTVAKNSLAQRRNSRNCAPYERNARNGWFSSGGDIISKIIYSRSRKPLPNGF